MNSPTNWRTAAVTPVARTAATSTPAAAPSQHTPAAPLLRLAPDPARGLFILAALATLYYAVTGGVFAVTGELSRWGAALLSLAGFDAASLAYYRALGAATPLLSRTDGVMLLALVLASAACAALSGRGYLRRTASVRRAAMALGGGFLAGFGARLAGGCNLANFFTGIPYFSLHPWVFALFMALGIACALVVLPRSAALAERAQTPYLPASAASAASAASPHSPRRRHRRRRDLLIAALPIAVLVGLFLHLGFGARPELAVALAFGAAFGAVIFCHQICFTSIFRDLFIFARPRVALACFAAMALSAVAVFALQLHGAGAKVLPISAALAVGAFIFGVGITLAGGCECGFIFRAASGQLHFWLVGAGNLLGTIALAFFYERAAGSWLYAGEKFRLEGFAGLLGLLALCAAAMAIIWLLARRPRASERAAVPSGCGSVLRVLALGEPCPYPALIYQAYRHVLLDGASAGGGAGECAGGTGEAKSADSGEAAAGGGECTSASGEAAAGGGEAIQTLEIICDCEQSLASIPELARRDGLRCEITQAENIIFSITR